MKIEIDKPVIPQFVADWIELCKDGGINVYDAMTDNLSNSMMDWLFNEEKVDDFAKAWVIGYEVEKEPLYYAKIKGWEHVGTSSYYFGYDEDNDSLEVTYLESNYRFAFSLTKEHWNKLGINGMNSDFEEVVW